MRLHDNTRQYRVLKLTNKDFIYFWNKHTKDFVSASLEHPKRINNHIGLIEALDIMKDNETIKGKLIIDYL